MKENIKLRVELSPGSSERLKGIRERLQASRYIEKGEELAVKSVASEVEELRFSHGGRRLKVLNPAKDNIVVRIAIRVAEFRHGAMGVVSTFSTVAKGVATNFSAWVVPGKKADNDFIAVNGKNAMDFKGDINDYLEAGGSQNKQDMRL